MHANSTQEHFRFSLWFALISFLGCGLFSAFYFYKDRELIDALAEQAEEIKEMEGQCAIPYSVSRPSSCDLISDRHLRFQRKQAARQTYRDRAEIFFGLSLAAPLLTLAIGRWWYWVITGRFRPRKRTGK
jgi:hypothetical protein